MEQKEIQPGNMEEQKPDLRHDTMEFAAPVEGEDKLDFDDEHYEEDEISAEELNNLEDDSIEAQEYALVAVETDLQADDDILPEEEWTKDIPGGKANPENDGEVI